MILVVLDDGVSKCWFEIDLSIDEEVISDHPIKTLSVGEGFWRYALLIQCANRGLCTVVKLYSVRCLGTTTSISDAVFPPICPYSPWTQSHQETGNWSFQLQCNLAAYTACERNFWCFLLAKADWDDGSLRLSGFKYSAFQLFWQADDREVLGPNLPSSRSMLGGTTEVLSMKLTALYWSATIWALYHARTRHSCNQMTVTER